MRLPSGATVITVEPQENDKGGGWRRKTFRARLGALFRGSGEDTRLEVRPSTFGDEAYIQQSVHTQNVREFIART